MAVTVARRTEAQQAAYEKNSSKHGSCVCLLCGRAVSSKTFLFVSEGMGGGAEAMELLSREELIAESIFRVGPECARKLPSTVVFHGWPEEAN